jgi:hypothetical protein
VPRLRRQAAQGLLVGRHRLQGLRLLPHRQPGRLGRHGVVRERIGPGCLDRRRIIDRVVDRVDVDEARYRGSGKDAGCGRCGAERVVIFVIFVIFGRIVAVEVEPEAVGWFEVGWFEVGREQLTRLSTTLGAVVNRTGGLSSSLAWSRLGSAHDR